MFVHLRQSLAGRATARPYSIIVGLMMLLLTACDAPNVAPLTPTALPQATAKVAPVPTVTTVLLPTATPTVTITSTQNSKLITQNPPTTVPTQNSKLITHNSPTPTQHSALSTQHSIKQVWRGPAGKHEVAITFDAGGGSGDVPAILLALRQRNIHITFFLTGKWVAENSDAARLIAADGHDISNHSYNHLHLPTVLTDSVVLGEVSSAEVEIKQLTGSTPRPYFRFPYGEFDERTLQLVDSLGYTSVLWTLDSLDSVGQPKSAAFLVQRVTNSKTNLDGAIILMHVGNATSAQALPTILDRLAAKGYKVVSIAELLK